MYGRKEYQGIFIHNEKGIYLKNIFTETNKGSKRYCYCYYFSHILIFYTTGTC